MLVTTKEMFRVAREKGFAVPAANFFDLDSLRYHVEVAEEMGLPIILALAEAHVGKYVSFEDAVLLGKKYAEAAKVPVALHLDHGTNPDLIRRAIDAGFTSVMIDASNESFEENVRRTREIIEYAHARGVVVEAEIGHVGIGHNIGVSEGGIDNSSYTTCEEAVAFIEATGVDSLAISIGTSHGLYRGTPKINFERLAEIAAATETPLVLHGGSSSGDENLHRCAKEGIRKINIYTDFLVAAQRAVEEEKPDNYIALREAVCHGVKGCLRHYYKVFATEPV